MAAAIDALVKKYPYIYGTVDLSYADFYYGELNDVEASSTMDLTAADKVTASNYRKDGMYDAVSSATTTKQLNLELLIIHKVIQV